MNRIKRIPFLIKGIIVVLLVTGVVFATANALRIMEEKQQKPRVLTAMAELVSGVTDEKYSLEKFWQLFENGKIEYSGEISLSSIEESLLPAEYQTIIPYLERSTVDFTLQKDDVNRTAALWAKPSLYWLSLEMEGYLNDTECIVRVPDFHESYISFSPDNLKAQYDNSLLYTVFGEQQDLPQDNLTDYVFHGSETLIYEEKEAVSMRFLDTVKLVAELYEEITVEKTERKENIFFNGSYRNCEVYNMTVPTAEFNRFLKDTVWEKSGHTIVINDEQLPIVVYLDSEKRILKLELAKTDIQVDGKNVPTELFFYPKGTENPWDSVQFGIEATWDDVVYGVTIVYSNEFTEAQRTMHVSFSLTEPYVTKFLDIDIDYIGATGESDFDFACKTPMLSFDGVLDMKPLTGSVEKPTTDAVAVFELNLLEILKFTNEINWGFFKNLE